MEKTYTIRFSRTEKHLLAAEYSISADTRELALEKARALWESGAVVLQYAAPLESSDVNITAEP